MFRHHGHHELIYGICGYIGVWLVVVIKGVYIWGVGGGGGDDGRLTNRPNI